MVDENKDQGQQAGQAPSPPDIDLDEMYAKMDERLMDGYLAAIRKAPGGEGEAGAPAATPTDKPPPDALVELRKRLQAKRGSNSA